MGNTEGATWGVVRAFWLPDGASVLSFRQKVESPGLSKRRFCAFDWPKRRSACLGLSSFWRNDHKASYPSRAPGAPQIGASCATLGRLSKIRVQIDLCERTIVMNPHAIICNRLELSPGRFSAIQRSARLHAARHPPLGNTFQSL